MASVLDQTVTMFAFRLMRIVYHILRVVNIAAQSFVLNVVLNHTSLHPATRKKNGIDY